MGSIVLFVYGTLKRGQRNHHLLADQQFIRAATTLPHFRLFDSGPYPCMVRDSAGIAIQGELWQVDESARPRLDDLEAAPILFRLEEIAVQGHAGPVFAYLFNLDVSSYQDSGESWP